jgi:hypothetical protein
MPRISCFISPHGFGHAAREAAIMAALHQQMPDVEFDLFTHVPTEFFHDSQIGPFQYYPLLSDIGLVQLDALHEDVPATIQRLNSELPFNDDLIASTADLLKQLNTALVLCDISPLGILIAEAAGIPSVLIENFTWDWIYRGYAETHPDILPHADYLGNCFERASYHVQTQPVCNVGSPDLTTTPIGRQPHNSPAATRQKLDIPKERKLVLISMGGIPEEHAFVESLVNMPEVDFLLPGIGDTLTRQQNVLTLPHHSDLYHPDLVNASDCVIGKVGYSTIAEVYHAGVPFGYVSRPHFRESPPLAEYIQTHIPSLPISVTEFRSGEWIQSLPKLLAMERKASALPNGANKAVELIANILARQG